MDVTVLDSTKYPLQLISYAAGVCYNKQDNYSEKRVEGCIKSGHTSVVEHAHIVYLIEGISRSCLAQLTRHRHISLSVQSQRYVKFDEETLERGDWFVIPPSIKNDDKLRDEYCDDVDNQLQKYLDNLKLGIKPEDARFLLPEATKTSLVMSTNARELQSILKLRLDNHAQWEIRELANRLVVRTEEINREWDVLLEWLLEY